MGNKQIGSGGGGGEGKRAKVVSYSDLSWPTYSYTIGSGYEIRPGKLEAGGRGE